MLFENNVENNRAVILTLQDNGDLVVTLNPENEQETREEIERIRKLGRNRDDLIFQELVQDFVEADEFRFLGEEDKMQYGMLTGCYLIIAEDVDILDCGHSIIHGRIWWHERYAIEDAIEELLGDGLTLKKGADADPDAPSSLNDITCPVCGRVTLGNG